MIKVINIKEIVKKLVFLLIGIILLLICTSSFFEESIKNIANKISGFTLAMCLNINLPIKSGENGANNNEKETTIIKEVLNIELGMLNNVEQTNAISEKTTNVEVVENLEVESVIEMSELPKNDLVNENAVVEAVEEKNIKISYNTNYSNVKIKNQSGYELTEEILCPNYELENKKDIIIFHTHTCESYTASDNYMYQMTGNYRTVDLNYSVARVGKELKMYLDNYGYNVIHDTTFHDYPAYSGSYAKSMTTVENLLAQNPSNQIIIDIHRDAVGATNEYAPSVKINGESVAQLMIVVGTNSSGLEHPNWQQNLKVAIKIQQKAEELYPGLFRPVLVSSARYNQNLRPGALIVEVGATGNTMEQCLNSMKYFSKVLSEIL